MGMKHLQAGLIAVLLVAGAAMYWFQHQSQEKLRADNAALTAQNAALQSGSENLSNLLAQANSSQAVSKDQFNELLKLRGEVGQLRRQVGDIGKLRAENQRLQAAQVNNVPPPPAAVDPQEQEKLAAIQMINNARQGMLAFIMFANDNNNQLPTNAAAASRYLNNDSSFIETNFDILYQGPLNGLADPASTIVLKEKQAWQSFDGRWKKAYGFADGHAEVHAEPSDNFDDYENQHTVAPPASQ